MHDFLRVHAASLVSTALMLMVTVSAGPGAVAGQNHTHEHEQELSAHVKVPLYDDLGTHHRAISTRSPEAQAYFDQGIRLQYAFNHAEAVRSYEAALRFDVECAMCWWGLALAEGHNINAPLSDEGGRRAFQAIERAKELTESVTPIERRLIEALGERYGPDPSSDRLALDSAYSRVMAGVVREHPDDADVATLFGASLMNLSPWNYWDGPYEQRTAKSGTELIVETLEWALRLEPKNPGACHYYIHLMEAAFPRKGRGVCRSTSRSHARGRPHRAHAWTHLRPRRPIRGRRAPQRARRRLRRKHDARPGHSDALHGRVLSAQLPFLGIRGDDGGDGGDGSRGSPHRGPEGLAERGPRDALDPERGGASPANAPSPSGVGKRCSISHSHPTSWNRPMSLPSMHGA